MEDLVQAIASPADGQCDQLHAAEEENERLRLLLDGKFKEALLLRAGPSGDGFQFDFQATVVPLMAEHLAQTLKGLGGENYVTMEFNHEEVGPLLLTIQRRFGEYPAQKAGRLAADNASLRARIAELETALKPMKLLIDWFDSRHQSHLPDSFVMFGEYQYSVTMGDLRRARAVLADRKCGCGAQCQDNGDQCRYASPQREGDRSAREASCQQGEPCDNPENCPDPEGCGHED